MSRITRVLLPVLFAVTLFVSSALLFFVQPLVAKAVLPLLGGSPAVWNTCMVFFQLALLAGYGYAHVAPAVLGVRRHAVWHLALVLAPFLVLPLAVSRAGAPAGDANPIAWLLGSLIVPVGLPFFVLATSGPLLQRWFAGTGHPAAGDPYFLYSASNLGSMLALIGYPAVVEPSLPLASASSDIAGVLLPFSQEAFWTAGYGLLVILVFVCALALLRAGAPPTILNMTARVADAPSPRRPVTAWRRARWIALAFVPSSLMLSVTTYLTADIAAIPLLWVIPLAIYLLTYILAFSRRQLVSPSVWRNLQLLVVLLLTIVLISEATEPVWLLVTLHLAGLFVNAMVCHGELARDRPSAEGLTDFYWWLSVGGALGGLFNGLAAPVLFSGIAEYPVVLVLACLLRRSTRPKGTGIGEPTEPGGKPPFSASRNDVLVPVALGLATAAVIVTSQSLGLPPGKVMIALVFAPPVVACYTFLHRPLRFALGVAAVFLAGLLYHGVNGKPLFRERSFFGVHRVTLDPTRTYRQLIHGNTVHGRQSTDEFQRWKPLTYYHPTGPIGVVFKTFSGDAKKLHVGVVGLGVGSLAAYAEQGQHWTFFEIDPVVARVARDPRYFTFLRDCPVPVDIKLGDARLTLVDVPDKQYGILVIDAFSSDAIPLHLLTREALRLYVSKLADDGVLAFHVSNRYLDLQAVLSDLARDAGLVCLARNELSLDREERAEGKSPSQWVVLLHRYDDFGRLRQSVLWRRLPGREGAPVWTDGYTNLLGVFKWQ